MGLEYFRAFPFIDYVVVGERRGHVPGVGRLRIALGQAGPARKASSTEQGEVRLEPNTALFTGFSETGPPDYDDYYHLLAELGTEASVDWTAFCYTKDPAAAGGEKHHCTFCGLNAQSMKFRAKSPDQVAREMAYLSSRYDTTRFRGG